MKSEVHPSVIHEGEALQAYAKEKGLVMASFAGQLGISRPTLYKWFKSPNLGNDAKLIILDKINPAPAFLLGVTGEPSLNTLLTEIRTVKALLLQLIDRK